MATEIDVYVKQQTAYRTVDLSSIEKTNIKSVVCVMFIQFLSVYMATEIGNYKKQRTAYLTVSAVVAEEFTVWQ